MEFLAIKKVETSKQARQFQEAALVLNGGKAPDAVWAVYWMGRLVAVYIVLEHAWERLLHIKKGLDEGQEPTFQTKAEAEVHMDLNQSGMTKMPKYPSESPDQSAPKPPKL